MPKVVIYATQGCPFCLMEKEYFTSRGIAFEEVRVDESAEKAREMIEKSGQMGVPFTVITQEDGAEIHILGFDRKRLDGALNLQ